MDAEQPILHTGVVESFDRGIARVKIYHGSNCGSCPAKGGCASASFGEGGQVVDVHFDGELSIGQRVNVALRARTDFLAIVLAFGIPIALLVGTMLLTVQAGLGQVASGLISIGAIVAYFGVLALFRKQLHKKFELMIVV
jgi:sigma-E factor negative regulatory protein RseC